MQPGSSAPDATRTNLDLLARVAADRLGAQLVAVFRPGGRPGEVEVVGGHAEGDAAVVLREGVLFAPVAGALHAEVLERGVVAVADVDPTRSARHLGVPAALDDAVARTLTTVAVAPVPVRGGPGGTLLVAWSGPVPPETDLAIDLARSGRRFGAVLAGEVVDEPLPLPMVGAPTEAPPPPLASEESTVHDGGAASAAGAPWLPTLAERLGMVVGLGAPIIVSSLFAASDDPSRYRPFSALVAIVVAVAAMAGRRAAIVAGASAVLSGWWALLPHADSFRLADGTDVVALVLFAAACAGVVWLISRLEEVRQREADERRLLDVLLDEAPIGIGLLDRSMRFRRANRRLAEIHRMAHGVHVGRTPGEVSPLEGEIYEPMLEAAAATGQRRLHHELALEVPELGTEQHLRISAYPLVGGDGRPVGVGTTVDDVTAEVLRRRRSDLLLSLSLELAGASRVAEAEDVAARLVATALRARTVVAHVDGDAMRVTTTSGYGPGVAERWHDLELRVGDGSALDRCIRSGELVLERLPLSADDDDDAAADDAETELRRSIGDGSYAWQPVQLPGSPAVVGAYSVAWPYERVVTEESQVLLKTVAAVAALAIGRIELAEEQAQDRFRTALDAMLDQVAIGRAIRGDDGTVEDFRLEFLNLASIDGAGRGAEELVGQRVCDAYPGWRESGMFDRFVRVVETGEPWVVEALRYEDVTPEGEPIVGYWNIQVVRVGDGYIAATRDVTDVVEAEAQAREAERVAERERLTLDLLQRAALPASLPEADGLELGAHYRPAERRHRIGGDWYDAFPLDDERTALVIADVSGHGAESAAFMVQARNIVRAIAAEEDRPGEVMRRANAVIECLEPEGRPFVTACLGIIDRGSRRLAVASAGHPPPLLVRDGEARYLDVAPGPPVGVFPDASWATTEVDLEPGDLIIGFTDGLVEVRGEVIDVGLERFRASVLPLVRSSGDAPSLADAIARAVTDPGDDLAVLVARLSDG
jgi:serine phosphatase RsbU (regulator of sigma subunit)